MKVELTMLRSGEAPRADGLGEGHIRVLSNDPLGPESWDRVRTAVQEDGGAFFEHYEKVFEKFYGELTELEDDEIDYDGWAFESWFVCKERRHL